MKRTFSRARVKSILKHHEKNLRMQSKADILIFLDYIMLLKRLAAESKLKSQQQMEKSISSNHIQAVSKASGDILNSSARRYSAVQTPKPRSRNTQCSRMWALSWTGSQRPEMMQSRLLLLLYLVCSSCGSGLDKHAGHSPPTKHVVNGEHNPEFDHQAVLGSRNLNEEMGVMSPDVAKRELGLLFDEHDVNRDGVISKEELIDWILHSFRSLDTEEAQHKLKMDDANKDGYVSWPEMLMSAYSYTPDEVEQFAEDKNKDVQAFVQLVRGDEQKFQAADADEDGQLHVTEYAAYLHPHNFEYTQDYEVKQTMALYDKNGDHVVDLLEYMGDKDKNRETQIVDSENFHSYDSNRDGVLDLTELRGWVLPDNAGIAEDEARHLLSETDMDNDRRLSKQEVLQKHELWVGSHAADNIHMKHHVLHDPGEL